MRDLGIVFLVGFMGCGKTTLGAKLARHLDYAFIDLDQQLEAQVGMTIAEYFAKFGEDGFRKLESEVLKTTVYPENAIVSTGGGLPCFFDNMDWMNSHGKTIYIQLSPKTLADRLAHEKHQRPILNGRSEQELLTFIDQKLQERDQYYTKASIIVNGIGITPEKVTELLNKL